MNRRLILASGLAAIAAFSVRALRAAEAAWTDLFDGKSLKNFGTTGDANWSIVDGAIQATSGNGFLLTPDTYRDFEVEAEFWTDQKANTGIFIRCSDRKTVNSDTAYEVNVFDERPDPTYGTGAIVDVAKVEPHKYVAANKWNTYRITARGNRMTVVLNGVTTAHGQDAKHSEGAVALQYAGGTVKFRKVRIRRL